MFFRKKSELESNNIELRWDTTEIYDKRGKEVKLVNTKKVLQYRNAFDKPWCSVWHNYNEPIYLEDSHKNG